MSSNATNTRTVTADLPDYVSQDVEFTLLSSVAISGVETFPLLTYTMSLDENGEGTIDLPTPDATGDAAWAWRIELPDGKRVQATLAYDAASLGLADWLAAELTTETPNSLETLLAAKQDKDTDATNDNLAKFASGQTVDSGYGVLDEDDMSSDSATDLATQQSIKAYTDSAIDADIATHAALTETHGISAFGATLVDDADADAAKVTLELEGVNLPDGTLKAWASNISAYMSSITRTDRSNSSNHGYISITATVTWPDGSDGHIDGVEYPAEPNELQYFTASHVNSGKIVVAPPKADSFAAYTVVAPDYYVDASAAAGGDGSLATPFDALDDLPTLNDGDVVALASGETYTGTVTLDSNGGVYRYGSGAKPIIDCGVTFTSGSWSATAGQTNVYEQDVTIELHSSNSFVNVLEDGAHMTRVADVATCDSTAGSFTVSVDTGSGDTTVTVYTHPTGSTDPTSNGSTYRYSRYLHGVTVKSINDTGVTADGVHSRLQSHQDGSIKLYDTSTIRHCKCEFGSKHNVFTGDASTVLDCDIVEAYINESFTMLVIYAVSAGGGDLTVRDCYLSLTTYDSNAVGFFAHTGSGTFGDVEASRIYADNIELAIDPSEHSGLTVSYCILTDVNRGVRVRDAGSVSDCTITARSDADNQAVVFDSVGTTSVTNCTISWVQTGGILLSTSSINLTVTGCTFDMGATGASTARGINLTGGGTLTHTDNIYLASDDWAQRLYLTDDGMTLVSNRNTYANDNGVFMRWGSTNYNTFVAWQVLGYDEDSSIDTASSAWDYTGADAAVVTGTAGTANDLAIWNADGDLVDGPTPPSGAIVGTTDTQTLSNKTLAATTLSGQLSAADQTIERPVLTDYGETVDEDTDSGATHTLDFENGNVHKLTLTANCTLTLSNPPTSGTAGSMTLILIQDGTGSRTLTWPASCKFAGGTEPTLTTDANAIDVLTLLTYDGGTSYLVFESGLDFS